MGWVWRIRKEYILVVVLDQVERVQMRQAYDAALLDPRYRVFVISSPLDVPFWKSQVVG